MTSLHDLLSSLLVLRRDIKTTKHNVINDRDNFTHQTNTPLDEASSIVAVVGC